MERTKLSRIGDFCELGGYAMLGIMIVALLAATPRTDYLTMAVLLVAFAVWFNHRWG